MLVNNGDIYVIFITHVVILEEKHIKNTYLQQMYKIVKCETKQQINQIEKGSLANKPFFFAVQRFLGWLSMTIPRMHKFPVSFGPNCSFYLIMPRNSIFSPLAKIKVCTLSKLAPPPV